MLEIAEMYRTSPVPQQTGSGSDWPLLTKISPNCPLEEGLISPWANYAMVCWLPLQHLSDIIADTCKCTEESATPSRPRSCCRPRLPLADTGYTLMSRTSP